MCGVAGAFSYRSGGAPAGHAIVSALNDLNAPRGPDGSGLWVSGDLQIILAHRRLAIIDTGETGAQPMTDSSGRWTITFNGEIYNYRALRSELEKLGYQFRTNSDTEALVNTIAHWGENGLTKLRGMYAFALWDDIKKELWLARDPYGIKPLYLAERKGTIWFSSQARSLASCAPVDTRRDPAALVGFYLWGFVPEPFSWWSGIGMLPAGHVQRVRLGEPLRPSKAFTRIEEFYANRQAPIRRGELRKLISNSVLDHLIADVPVGVFLSSGIDSNVIASLAAEHVGGLKTVTLAFDEFLGTENDEAPLAEIAARTIQSDHTTVRIGRDQFNDLFDDFIKSMDQPSIDGLNTYLLSHATASQGLKVALSGLGGDELFGGYPSFKQIPTLLKWGRRTPVKGVLGQSVLKMLRTIAPMAPPKLAGLLAHSSDLASAYLLRRALYLEDELDSLLDESWLTEGLERLATRKVLSALVQHLDEATEYARISVLESCWYMRNQLLRDTDWASMTHGLEVRVPLVDANLIHRLAPAIGSDRPPTKQDLAACAGHLPPDIATRRKTGFVTPVQTWIARKTGEPTRGLRGWAANIHREFRALHRQRVVDRPSVAAA